MLTQGLGVATGLQESFSWAGVAAAGVGGGVGGAVRGRFGGSFEGQIGTSTASALANAATRSALDGSNFGDNIVAAIPDVVGQALGNAVGSAVTPGNSNTTIEAAHSAVRASQSTAIAGAVQRSVTASPVISQMDEVIVTGTRNDGIGDTVSALTARLSARLDAQGSANLNRIARTVGSPVTIEDIGRNYNVPLPPQVATNAYALSTEGTFIGDLNINPFPSNFGTTTTTGEEIAFANNGLALSSGQVWKGAFGSVGQLDRRTAFLEFNPLGQFIGDFGIDLINLGRLQRNAGHHLDALKSQALGIGKYGLMVGGAEAAGVHVIKRIGSSLSLTAKGERVLFSQRRMDISFSNKNAVPDYLAGRNINDVAEDLAFGRLSSDDIMIQYFRQGNELVSVNTRGLAALSLAGRKPTHLVEVTPTPSHRRRLIEVPVTPIQILPGPVSVVTPSRNDLTVLQTIRVSD